MNNERRRYFRIEETVGISYEIVNGGEGSERHIAPSSDVLELVSTQDHKIERLLLEIADEHPKVAELVTVFNQKLERIVHQLLMESHLVGKIANRVQEANISACGIAFANDEDIAEGSRLKLELSLYPTKKKIVTDGIVVGCDPAESGGWYWRVDFYGMTAHSQENLIQHIVQTQSAQLKSKRNAK